MMHFLLLLLVSSCWGQDDQVILLTGGWNGEDVLNSTEVLGSASCQVADLPENRELHSNALTADGLVLTIAGDVRSVLALDPAAGAWTPHSEVDADRFYPAVVSMPDAVYLLGGDNGGNESLATSSKLPTGSTYWSPGPPVPEGGVHSSCAVPISETQFVIIGGKPNTRQVTAYDTATGEWTAWPLLTHGRWGHSCARQGDTIVFSGGYDDSGYYTASTSIIDIIKSEESGEKIQLRERPGGDMSVNRIYHGMVALGDTVLTFGGEYGAEYWDSMEQWDPDTEQWGVINQKMEHARTYFGYTSAPASALCAQ